MDEARVAAILLQRDEARLAGDAVASHLVGVDYLTLLRRAAGERVEGVLVHPHEVVHDAVLLVVVERSRLLEPDRRVVVIESVLDGEDEDVSIQTPYTWRKRTARTHDDAVVSRVYAEILSRRLE